MHNFTPEDLIQFLYRETSPQKEAAIKAALEDDWSLRETFESIVSAQNNLEPLHISPREEVINKLLQHAEKALSELHHH